MEFFLFSADAGRTFLNVLDSVQTSALGLLDADNINKTNVEKWTITRAFPNHYQLNGAEWIGSRIFPAYIYVHRLHIHAIKSIPSVSPPTGQQRWMELKNKKEKKSEGAGPRV